MRCTLSLLLFVCLTYWFVELHFYECCQPRFYLFSCSAMHLRYLDFCHKTLCCSQTNIKETYFITNHLRLGKGNIPPPPEG